MIGMNLLSPLLMLIILMFTVMSPGFAGKAVELSVHSARGPATADLSCCITEAQDVSLKINIDPNKTKSLAQLDKQMVMQDGQKIHLQTVNIASENKPPYWRTRVLAVIANPTVAYLLLLLGAYAVLFELITPGLVLPGVIGVIALLMALYGMQLLPVSYAGLSLIILGLGFIIAEAFAPSFGALALGGTLVFLLGSVMLIDSDQKNFQIAKSVIWAMAAANGIIVLSLTTMALKSKKKKLQHGVELMIGTEGRALGQIHHYGQAVIKGEIWSVHTKNTIAGDKRVKVIAVDGLQLEVEVVEG